MESLVECFYQSDKSSVDSMLHMYPERESLYDGAIGRSKRSLLVSMAGKPLSWMRKIQTIAASYQLQLHQSHQFCKNKLYKRSWGERERENPLFPFDGYLGLYNLNFLVQGYLLWDPSNPRISTLIRKSSSEFWANLFLLVGDVFFSAEDNQGNEI